MDSERAAWEYVDFAAAGRKLKAIIEDESVRRGLETYFQGAPQEPRYLTNSRNWRARNKLADGSHTSEEVEQMVRDQGGMCAYCESSFNGAHHVDHMIPLSRGGSNDWTNLAITCVSCNLSKNSMTVEEVLEEFLSP